MKAYFLMGLFFCCFESVSMEESEHDASGCLLQRTCVICGEKDALGDVYFTQLNCGHFAHTGCLSKAGGRFYCDRCELYVRKSINLCLTSELMQKKESSPKKGCCFCFKRKK
jgi:hypothetical protein